MKIVKYNEKKSTVMQQTTCSDFEFCDISLIKTS